VSEATAGELERRFRRSDLCQTVVDGRSGVSRDRLR